LKKLLIFQDNDDGNIFTVLEDDMAELKK